MWVVSLLGAAVFLMCAYGLMHRHAHIYELMLFSALVFIAELIPTKIPGTDLEMAMTMPLAINLFLSNGIEAMVVFASLPMLIASFIIQRQRPRRLLLTFSIFNAADFIISASVAAMAYYMATGQTIVEAGGNMPISSMILPLAAWTGAYNVMNALLGAVGSSLYNPQEWKALMLKGLQYNIPNFFLSVPVSILFASFYMARGWEGILLLIFPLLAGRHAANLYSQSIDAYRDTITSLGSLMQRHHPYTKGHQERVAKLADMLAREMQLPVRSLMHIRDAGLLHDIGKVGVDYLALDKTEKLTAEDWAIVKAHPARGAYIIAELRYLDCIVPWVRCHHERPDGKGYPDGLEIKDIPIEAAVLAVADSFDAMTGGFGEGEQRSYRAPLSLEAALDQLRLGAGTQFNPQAADAFIRIMSHREDAGG